MRLLKSSRSISSTLFKRLQGAISTRARALRWVQFRLQEFSAALRAWVGPGAYPATVSTRRRVQALSNATLANGVVKPPLVILDAFSKKAWHPKLKSVTKQAIGVLQVTGYTRPNASITMAIAARAEMFAARASTAASLVEKDDISATGAAWKEWVALPGDASAAAAQRYTKASPSLTKLDLCGAPKSRAEDLQDEVSDWSALWQEGFGSPPTAFFNVPGLPPLTIDQVVRASKSFKRGTCALRGIHPRHVALLSHEAIATLINTWRRRSLLVLCPPTHAVFCYFYS